jgi:hypothetical protein
MRFGVLTLGAAALTISAGVALAASPNINSAIATFKAVQADAGKLKTYCAMSKTMNEAGEKEDPAIDAKVDGFMKQLGPDFQKAWNAGEGVDENSADGKALGAALDELESKCPQ